jgi:hypothetical protein
LWTGYEPSDFLEYWRSLNNNQLRFHSICWLSSSCEHVSAHRGSARADVHSVASRLLIADF